MKRRPLIAGNWKMHLTMAEAARLAAELVALGLPSDRDAMVAPAATAFAAVDKVISSSSLALGAQNVCWQDEGAFTGELSPLMLKDAGCSMVIVGHSERRQLFSEDDPMVNRRLLAASRRGLLPVLCIGETIDQRRNDETFSVLERQLRLGLAGLELADQPDLVVAYEPVWAIGTGQTATVAQAQEVHCFVRGLLAELYEKKIADGIRILYGGSVKAQNIDELMAQEDIDGALVGGAALEAGSFSRIINFKAT